MTGWRQIFLHPRTGESSTSLLQLYQRCTPEERQLSASFFQRYLACSGIGSLTPFAGLLGGPGPLAHAAELLRQADSSRRSSLAQNESDLARHLQRELTNALPHEEVAVAVSGGIDAWLLAALLKDHGYRVCGWYLETGIPGYCEREQVESSARALDIECRRIWVTAEDFVDAAAEFTAVVQQPIYNLHPVSKWLFAKGLQREGVTTVVMGDAADQVMRWDWDCDLLPLTLTCFQGAGIHVVAPFMTDGVIQFCQQPSQDKQPVRALAKRLGVPTAPKRPTMFPPVSLPTTPRTTLPVDGIKHTKFNADRISCLSYTTGLLEQLLQDA